MNTHCQPSCTATNTPTLGASIGDALITKMSNEMILAVSWAGKKSRTMAIAATPAAQPPTACTNRSAMSDSTFRANRHNTDATMNNHSPAYNGSLRPNRSSNGPYASCPAASPAK